MHDGQEEVQRLFSHAFDQCFEHRLLRVEVVIERSFGNLEVI